MKLQKYIDPYTEISLLWFLVAGAGVLLWRQRSYEAGFLLVASLGLAIVNTVDLQKKEGAFIHSGKEPDNGTYFNDYHDGEEMPPVGIPQRYVANAVELDSRPGEHYKIGRGTVAGSNS
ncbi:MAG: hypothetical protein AAFP08_08680, partial [Bacteroidota bacterium]